MKRLEQSQSHIDSTLDTLTPTISRHAKLGSMPPPRDSGITNKGTKTSHRRQAKGPSTDMTSIATAGTGCTTCLGRGVFQTSLSGGFFPCGACGVAGSGTSVSPVVVSAGHHNEDIRHMQGSGTNADRHTEHTSVAMKKEENEAKVGLKVALCNTNANSYLK